MADDRPGQQQPSWRGGPKPTKKPEPPAATPARHGWARRQDKTAPRTARAPSRSFLVGGIALGFLACLGAAALLLSIFRPTKSVAVVLVGADYATNLAVPHNALGWQGLHDIGDVVSAPGPWSLFRRSALRLEGTKGQPRVIEYRRDWDDLIDGLEKAKIREDAILIVVALHGGSDSQGAYLLPNKAAGPEDRLPLREMIRSLAKLPAAKPKILVVEGCIGADWRLGMLANEFARRLNELDEEIRGVKNLWVLSGSDVDQRCWSSEGLGRTALTHYLAEALRGRAATDGRLTLDDLLAYLKKNVGDWAWAARGEVQEPVLLPRGDVAKASGVALAVATRAQPPKAAPAFSRTEVARWWGRFRELDAHVPNPSVYSPRRWREFRAALVRHEELTRAGAADAASDVAQRLADLDRLIRAEFSLATLSGSVETMLAANVLRGEVLAPGPASDPAFGPFWQAPDTAEATRQWERIKAAAGRESARTRIDGLLLRLAAELPAQNLAKAVERLDIAKGTDYPDPAEAHFARMLGRSLAGRDDPRRVPEFWRVASQALALRVEAGRAALGLGDPPGTYHYAEEVQPRVRPAIEAADVLRRRGEDLIFSWNPADWEAAGDAFKKARALYKGAAGDAATLRSGLAARDRAMANLPAYSRWMARRLPDAADEPAVASLEALWAAAHEVVEALGGPAVAAVARVGPIAARIEAGMDALEKEFADQAPRVAGDRDRTDFDATSAAAAVAFRDSDDLALRATLWDRLDSIRAGDVERSGKPDGKAPTADARREALRRRSRRAVVQGRMALAALGRAWFDDPAAFPEPDQGGSTRAAERVRRPIPEAATDVEPWSKEIAVAGDQIGRRWRKIPEEIKRLVGDTDEIPDDLAPYLPRLASADHLARRIDGGEAPLPEKDVEAAGWYRRVRVHDLLIWLAERTWQDHWYDDDTNGPARRPYYQDAGSLLVKDAEALFPRSASARKVRELLARPGRFGLAGPSAPPVLTSEQGLEVTFGVVKSGDVPAGLPVIRPRPDGSIRIAGDTGGWRVVTPDGAGGARIAFNLSGPASDAWEFDPKVTRPAPEPATLGADLYFRGQRHKDRTAVEVHPIPEIIAVGPAPPTPPGANLTVRADDAVIRRFGEGTGSLAIILDCSGSMIPAVDNLAAFQRLRNTKFDEAKRALDEVLRQVPEGTRLSLWVFGQGREGLLDLNQPTEDDRADERDPRRTIRQLRPPERWRRDQRGPLMEQVNKLWPIYGTPLIDTMARAAVDLARDKGLKTLLVLTDGNDSEFLKGEIAEIRADVNVADPRRDRIHAEIRRQFAGKGVMVNMAFYRSDEYDFRRAEANFGVLRTLDPPGQVFRESRLAELMTTLSRSIRQRLTWDVVKPPEDKAVRGGPVEVAAGQSWPDGLEPGPYGLKVQADKGYRKEINLARGDRLIVRLAEEDEKLVFRRGLYSDEVPGAESREVGGARLSSLGSVVADDQGKTFALLASLESLEEAGPRLEEFRPRFAWFDLAAKDAKGEPTFALRWREQAFYPAAVWQFDIPRWVPDPGGQGPARPVLSAVWTTDAAPARSARFDVARLSSPESVDHAEVGLADGKSVVIESLRLEDHRVEHRPGEAPLREHCLVVRIDYRREGDAVLIDPEGLREAIGVVGHEHRVYTRARKYAGVFWPVNRDQLARLKTLDIIALARVRREAAERKQTIRLDNLSPPKVSGRLPRSAE